MPANLLPGIVARLTNTVECLTCAHISTDKPPTHPLKQYTHPIYIHDKKRIVMLPEHPGYG